MTSTVNANFSDVASKINTPQQMSLGDMVNMARAAQAYQQAQQINPLALQQQQQTTQSGGIDLTQKQQGFKESQALQSYFSNPENYMKDGRIDIETLNREVPKIAPLTGAEYITKLTTLAKEQTNASKAKQELTQDQRKIISSPMAILGRMNVTDPKVYKQELENIRLQNPENQSLHRLIDSYLKVIDTVHAEQLPTLAIKSAQSLLTPTEQEEKFAKKAETKDIGGQLISTVTSPSVGGQAPTIEKTGVVSGKSLTPQVVTTETGAPQVIGGGGAGAATPQTGPLPTNMGLPTGVAGQTKAPQVAQNLAQSFEAKGGLQRAPDETYARYKARVERLGSLPDEANKAMNLANQDSIPNQEYLNNKVLKLLDNKNLDIGPLANAIANKTNGIGLNSDQQEVIKYLEQRIRTEGSRSNEDQQSQRSAFGSFGTNKEALRDIIYNDKGLLASKRLYNQGILKAQGDPTKPNLAAVNRFENEFNQLNNDPNLSHLLGVIGNKTKEQLTNSDKQHLKKIFGGLSNEQIQGLFDKKQKLEALVSGAQ